MTYRLPVPQSETDTSVFVELAQKRFEQDMERVEIKDDEPQLSFDSSLIRKFSNTAAALLCPMVR